MAIPHAPDQLLTPADVAALAFVDPKTVGRWARAGKIPFETTPGGHRRFRRSDVEALLHQVRDHLPLDSALAPGARSAKDPETPAAHRLRSAAADAVVAEAVAIAMDAQAEAAAIEAAQARAIAAAEAARVVAHEAAVAADRKSVV